MPVSLFDVAPTTTAVLVLLHTNLAPGVQVVDLSVLADAGLFPPEYADTLRQVRAAE